MAICFLQYERDQHCRSSSSPNYSEKTTREGGGRRRRALNTYMCTSKNCGPALLHILSALLVNIFTQLDAFTNRNILTNDIIPVNCSS